MRIQYGQVCKGCAGGACHDEPNRLEPLLIECIECGGGPPGDPPCGSCGGTGRIRVESCPKRYVGSETWEFLAVAAIYKRGLAPVSGGSLDQVKQFNDACLFAWSQGKYWENKIVSPNRGG